MQQTAQCLQSWDAAFQEHLMDSTARRVLDLQKQLVAVGEECACLFGCAVRLSHEMLGPVMRCCPDRHDDANAAFQSITD